MGTDEAPSGKVFSGTEEREGMREGSGSDEGAGAAGMAATKVCSRNMRAKSASPMKGWYSAYDNRCESENTTNQLIKSRERKKNRKIMMFLPEAMGNKNQLRATVNPKN